KDVTPAGVVDTSKPGTYTGVVEVTYPDGSKETVNVPVIVKTVPATGLTIGDRVWNDANANGLQDQGEVGLEGVTVALVKPDGTIITTTTDKNGHYAFTGLPAGTYTVYFNTPVNAISTLVNVDFNGHDAIDSDGSVITIQLTEDNMTIDSGFYFANGGNTGSNTGGTDNGTNTDGNTTPGENPGNNGGTVVVPPVTKGNLTIGNRVWNDANANGLQDQGEVGLEGVTVALVKPDGTIITTTTDKNGHYAFTGLPAGTYTVYFNTPANAISTLVNVDFNGHDAIDSDGSVITIQLTEDNMTIDSGFYFANGGGTGSTPGGTDNGGGTGSNPGGTDNGDGTVSNPGGTDNGGDTDRNPGGTTPAEDPSENTAPIKETEDVPTDGTAPENELGNVSGKTTETSQVSLPDTGEKDNSGLAAGALLLGGLTLLAGRKKRKEDIESEEK
ncbi:hypothetical protein BHU61_09940, partial [Macrococcus epidermidis]